MPEQNQYWHEASTERQPVYTELNSDNILKSLNVCFLWKLLEKSSDSEFSVAL